MKQTLYTRTPSLALIKRAQKIADTLAANLSQYPKGLKGRGIVTCGGGYTYFTNAWVLIRMLRYLGCDLPIQLWHLGPNEVSNRMKRIVSEHGVECVDGTPHLPENRYVKKGLVKGGWILKSIAIAKCPFEEVLFLDADNLPLRDPTFLFELPPYKTTGAIFWPDSSVFAHKSIWRIFRVPPVEESEFESGQAVIDKRINWEAVSLAEQINCRADVFYRLIWGDKDTFRFAWRKLGRTFAMPNFAPQALRAADSEGDMLCQHDFEGNRLFQHRIMYKWNLFGENPWISGFFFENECRAFLEELKLVWNGRCRDDAFVSPALARLPVTRDLLNTAWLLQLPQASRQANRGGTVDIREPVADQSGIWMELTFNKNGTFCNRGGNEKAGTFWDLKDSARGLRLTLSGEDGPRVSLKQVQTGWHGSWVGGLKGSTKMLLPEGVYPHLKKRSRPAHDEKRTILKHFNNEVHVGLSLTGIGDSIVGAYACAGLAQMGVKVIFHTPDAEWLERIKEPRLSITPKIPKRVDYDLHYDFGNHLRYAKSRALWYAGRLHPLLKPATPKVNRTPIMRRLPFERYVLFSPVAKLAWREWPEIHWTRLAHMLREAGYEVVVIGRKCDEQRLQNIFATTQAYWVAGHPPAWVMDAMLDAAAYVGLDSGMTHLAALLRARAVAIHSQLSPEFLWPKGTVTSVAPDAQCVFCRWQGDRGFFNSCQKSCSALASVRPETVLDAVLDVMKTNGTSGIDTSNHS